MPIRLRSSPDVAACLGLLREVHLQDGYPTRWPEDPRRFLAPPREIAAWVATQSDASIGHVALHRNDHFPAVDTACVDAGVDPDQVGIVARLLTAPAARRRGIGRELLGTAVAEAHRAGLRPVLDVAKPYEGAIALYEACGWTRAGELTLAFRNGLVLESWLYVGPKQTA
jgi:GNAT superfamily N-acetyltransferase